MATQFEGVMCCALTQLGKSIVLNSEQKECVEAVYMGKGCLFVFTNKL